MAITTKLIRASEDNKNPVRAVLLDAHTPNSGGFSCESLEGWSAVAAFTVYEVDVDGEPVDGTESDWIGERVNNTLVNCELTAGEDRPYLATSTQLIANNTAASRNKLIEGLGHTLTDEGELKPGVVTGDKVADGTLTGDKLADGTLTGDKLANQTVTPDKIDWSLCSRFSSYATNNQSIAKNSYVPVTLGSKEYDTTNEFSASRFTANKPRKMTFSGLVTLNVATGNMAQTALLKNGALLKRGARIISGGTGVMALPVTADAEVAAGDYIQLAVIVYQDNISTVGSATETFLMGHEIQG